MSFVVLMRNPTSGAITALVEEDEPDAMTRLAQFPTEEAADDFAMRHKLCEAWGYHVLEVP